MVLVIFRSLVSVTRQNVQQVRSFSLTNIIKSNNVLKYSVNANLDKSIVNRYLKLPIPKNNIIAKYVWIDGTEENLRAKSRTLDYIPKDVGDLPVWNYDGSSTYQASGENSDMYLCPRRIYKDPFRGGDHILVLCDTYDFDKKPTKSNHRAACEEAMKCIEDCEPMWGIEQEFTLMGVDGRPLGWPVGGFPAPQGPYYCGVGADKVYGRSILESLYFACLYSGIEIAGTNAEVMPGQMEYQCGASLGMKCPDDIWMSRYILHRIAEEYGVVISFDPKPVPGPWNGSGAHTNFSTKLMREDNGIKEINAAIAKLEKKHKDHIKAYDPQAGACNKRRLTGELETSSLEKFSSGVANRGVSVRIPRSVAEAKKGYFEDRRPASNMDPYAVCNAIVRTCFIN